MKLISDRYLRFQIMLIALVGSVSLVAFIVLTVSVVKHNRDAIVQLDTTAYPALEKAATSRLRLPGLREKTSNAIALADSLLLEDAERQLREIRKLLADVAVLTPVFAVDAEAAQFSLNRYHSVARDTVAALLQQPDANPRAVPQAEVIERLYRETDEHLQQLQFRLRESYQRALATSERSLDRSLQVIAVLGVATLLLLFVLSLVTALRVARYVQRSHQLKDEFLATVSHEMRTPLHGIRGGLELLDTQTMTAEHRQYWRAASDSADELLRLVNDMLDFTDLQTGDLSHIDRVFNLRALVQMLADKYQPQCERKGLAFYFSEDESIDVDLVGDDQRIAHVVSHLLENALRYTEHGSIKFAVHGNPMRGRTHDYSVRFIISDTGPGIAPERLDLTFNQRTLFEGSHTRHYGRVGVGLPVCRRIVELMGGSMHYSHAPDHGSILTVLIPLCRAHEAMQTERQVETPAADLQTTVLVVEDNKVNQMVLKGFLQRLHCRVLMAANGREAIDLVARENIDVILMDCEMPVLDGFEATRLIRQMPPPLNAIPIIAVTANAHDSDRRRCLQAGMNDYLKKPVDFDTIRRRIELIRRPLALVRS